MPSIKSWGMQLRMFLQQEIQLNAELESFRRVADRVGSSDNDSDNSRCIPASLTSIGNVLPGQNPPKANTSHAPWFWEDARVRTMLVLIHTRLQNIPRWSTCFCGISRLSVS